ncbi:MAG: hypothetical protein ACFE9I_06735 [Candidatus Hermodarchaeota archaeon]
MKGLEWCEKFLNHPKAMLEILEASYQVGARGVEVIPIGKVLDAAKIMVETHNDYVITGSTYPGIDSKIDSLIGVGAKLIYVHGMISDERNSKLIELLDEISNHGIIPGIASHDPIVTISHAVEKNLNVKVFLIPFNAHGSYMENAKKLEEIVDKTKMYDFIAMKTLAAGRINPEKAFTYISKHNISAVTIGMVTKFQAEESTKIALKFLSSRRSF